ncbi:MAG TPA: hypothetical protein VL354_04810 [Spirochaetia bacterium]|nr:hypothetical protein [Spirochaetia bacterium]
MTRRVLHRPRYPNKFLVLGVAGVVVGGLLLLWNFGYLPQPGQLWPVPVLIAGLFFLYLAWPRKHSDTWIIPGMVLTLAGLVFLLANTVLSGGSLKRIWPVFMLITGISLVPYGLRKKASARAAIMVPAIFISCLALFFLLFSLHREEGGLVAFVRQWWPMILVVLGVALIISFFSTRRPSNKI